MKKTDSGTIEKIRNFARTNPEASYEQIGKIFGKSEITVKRICADLGRGKNWRRGRVAPVSDATRFWAKVDRAGGDCWLWLGRPNNSGYGFTYFEGKSQAVHRVAYILSKGMIPEKMELDHLCRNRTCCNPEHLEPVTHAKNMIRVRAAAAQRGAISGTGQQIHFPPVHGVIETESKYTCVAEQKKNEYLERGVPDPLRIGARKSLAEEKKMKEEDKRWGLEELELSEGNKSLDDFNSYNVTVGRVRFGLQVSVPARSPQFAKEMVESIWGTGYHARVTQESKLKDLEAAFEYLCTWRSHLKKKYAAWEVSEEGLREIEMRSVERREREFKEDLEQELNWIYDKQEELRNAERKEQRKKLVQAQTRYGYPSQWWLDSSEFR